jgi:hypothetical protein
LGTDLFRLEIVREYNFLRMTHPISEMHMFYYPKEIIINSDNRGIEISAIKPSF